MDSMGSPERDWQEDRRFENGQYFCKCLDCGETFIGHKRRLQCKSCAIKAMSNKILELEEQVRRKDVLLSGAARALEDLSECVPDWTWEEQAFVERIRQELGKKVEGNE